MSLRPRLWVLLLVVSGLVLLAPVLALVAFRVYDGYLVRQTERQLIAQGVVIGEAYRALLARELGRPITSFRPPGREGEAFIPIEPVIELTYGVLPRDERTGRPASEGDSPERRAGAALEELLLRSQVFNLSGVRVLDAAGCVVATSRGDRGRCLEHLPEVQEALAGSYHAVARERISDEPLPPISDVRSRGAIRIFAALPLFSEGRVIGVVQVSRTSLDALTSLWHARRGLLVLVASSLLLAVLASLGLAAFIARPLRRLTRTAQAIERGEPHPRLSSAGMVPAELHALSVALDTMTLKLEQRAAYIAEFAANVSHELKTPITAIRGAAELLRDSFAAMSDEQRRRFLDNISKDADRMERLVARLLALARIEHAPEPGTKVAVRPFFAALAERYPHVPLRLDAPPEAVLIDADHLGSAVTNLLDNALRHGGGAPVELRVSGASGRLRVEVTDGGPGISPANQPRIFSRFFTTERDAGGTGLGLSIVHAIAARARGRVWFESRPGKTTFTLEV